MVSLSNQPNSDFIVLSSPAARSAAFNPERIYPELVEGVEWGRSQNVVIWGLQNPPFVWDLVLLVISICLGFRV